MISCIFWICWKNSHTQENYVIQNSLNFLTLPAPIPDKQKKLTFNFILIQLFEMHRAGRVNVLLKFNLCYTIFMSTVTKLKNLLLQTFNNLSHLHHFSQLLWQLFLVFIRAPVHAFPFYGVPLSRDLLSGQNSKGTNVSRSTSIMGTISWNFATF